jgi:hypothetical protein
VERRTLLLAFAASVVVAADARAQSRMPMHHDWDAMDHDQRSRAMDRMRRPHHEPTYEAMRERWNKMSPDARQKMMERHDKMHGKKE